MADLVAQYTGEFSFIIKMSHNPPGKIDKSTRNRKGIDYRGIDNFKIIFKIGPMGNLNHFAALFSNETLQCWIVINSKERSYFRISLLTHSFFLILGNQHEILLSGNRIGGAGRKEESD